MNKPTSGKLLIADPFLQDPNFKRTVIFLCEHLQEGSFGLVLNKQLNITLGELITELEGNDTKIYFGGPVQMDTIHFLHQLPESIPDGVQVAEGVYWGGDFKVAINLLQQNQVDGHKIRFFLGYSGWDEGQLIKEVKDDAAWLMADSKANLVFHHNYNNLWKDAIGELGNDYAALKNYPIDPRLN